MKLQDLTGQRFERLMVVERNGARGGKPAWKCVCDCGNFHTVAADVLKTGRCKSCGCLKREVDAVGTRYRHGMSTSVEHKTWCGMRDRCSNPNATFYAEYGGRGISVCDRWQVFESFYADMGPRPYGCTIDRINNDGNYEPGNCRWAPKSTQANNTRKNVFATIGGVTQTIAEWCRETGVDPDLASQRIIRDGWEPEDAVSKPSRKVRAKQLSKLE